MTLSVQTAKWTLGPSLPTESPDPMDNGKPIDLIIKVLAPRNPFMTKPAMITLISDMPDPAAYGAKQSTRIAEENAKRI